MCTTIVSVGPLLAVADETDLPGVQIERAVCNHVVLEMVHRLKLVED